ncbi:MAG: gamma carbonic anhydrase family protein [Lachnospiraceae bacterium]|nr:gamma carbonic anhydrase family protein [Lachnospiraceae bacterium]
MIKNAKIDPSAWVAHSADVIGNVEIGEESSVWYHATIRGDLNYVKIGAGTNIQDGVVIHVDTGCPCEIGSMVTIGHNATIHGCTIGNRTLIGMGAILLNGCKIGRDCIIGAGALVTSNKEIPDGSLVLGSPAKVIRALTEEEIKENEVSAMSYMCLKNVQ